MNANRRKWQLTLVAAVLAMVAAGLFGGNLVAQQVLPAVEEIEPENASVFVGVYQPQVVFEHYPGREPFMQQMQQMQAAMQAAAQAGDQERIMQLQQQAQQVQQKVIEGFHSRIEQALPEVAKAAEVQLIVVEVAYRNEDVAVRDVTERVVAALRQQAGVEVEQPQPQPIFPQLPQQ